MGISLTTLGNSALLLSGAIFIATTSLVLFVGLLFVPAMETRRRIVETLLAEDGMKGRSVGAQTLRTKAAAKRPVEAYFEAVDKERRDPDALEAKLFRAGFYQSYAPLVYHLTRV